MSSSHQYAVQTVQSTWVMAGTSILPVCSLLPQHANTVHQYLAPSLEQHATLVGWAEHGGSHV